MQLLEAVAMEEKQLKIYSDLSQTKNSPPVIGTVAAFVTNLCKEVSNFSCVSEDSAVFSPNSPLFYCNFKQHSSLCLRAGLKL